MAPRSTQSMCPEPGEASTNSPNLAGTRTLPQTGGGVPARNELTIRSFQTPFAMESGCGALGTNADDYYDDAMAASSPRDLFASKGAEAIYDAVVSRLRSRVGTVVEDPKQTCVHLLTHKNGTAFAGIHPRKNAVMLTIRTQAPLKSPRVRKVEQVSRNRCHSDLVVSSIEEVDPELLGWLSTASTAVAKKSDLTS